MKARIDSAKRAARRPTGRMADGRARRRCEDEGELASRAAATSVSAIVSMPRSAAPSRGPACPPPVGMRAMVPPLCPAALQRRPAASSDVRSSYKLEHSTPPGGVNCPPSMGWQFQLYSMPISDPFGASACGLAPTTRCACCEIWAKMRSLFWRTTIAQSGANRALDPT